MTTGRLGIRRRRFRKGAQVYIIERGDTLWDLAQRFLGNAYLWPQIWEQNQYILDSHWIYPGDPLVMGFEVEPADALERTPDDRTGMTDGSGDAAAPPPDTDFFGRGRIVQLGTPDDIYCSGFIGELTEDFGYHVVGSEYEVLGQTIQTIRRRGDVESSYGGTTVDAVKVGLTTGDIIYLDGGRAAGLSPGDLFTSVAPGDVVSHPLTGEPVGRYYQYLGQVRVLSTQEETAIAEITQSCHPLGVGSALKPYELEPIPSERRTPLRPVNEPTTAEALREAPLILHSKDGILTIGEDHVVFVDLGSDDGVVPGDIYTIYRRPIRNNPPVVIGEVAILSVHPLSSVAKVIQSRYPVYVGDPLEAK